MSPRILFRLIITFCSHLNLIWIFFPQSTVYECINIVNLYPFYQVSNNEITEFLENAYDFCQEKIQQATFTESNESKRNHTELQNSIVIICVINLLFSFIKLTNRCMLFPPWFITELLDYIYLKPNSNLSCIKLKIELTAQLIIIYHSEESIFFQIIKRFQGMVLQMKYPILSFHQE